MTLHLVEPDEDRDRRCPRCGCESHHPSCPELEHQRRLEAYDLADRLTVACDGDPDVMRAVVELWPGR